MGLSATIKLLSIKRLALASPQALDVAIQRFVFVPSLGQGKTCPALTDTDVRQAIADAILSLRPNEPLHEPAAPPLLPIVLEVQSASGPWAWGGSSVSQVETTVAAATL